MAIQKLKHASVQATCIEVLSAQQKFSLLQSLETKQELKNVLAFYRSALKDHDMDEIADLVIKNLTQFSADSHWILIDGLKNRSKQQECLQALGAEQAGRLI